MRCVDFPCENALSACPCACPAKWQDGRSGGCDRGVHHVHIADKHDLHVSFASVNLFVHDGIEQEFRVGCAGRDLPHHLNKEIAVKGGQQSLAVGARRGGILLCADIEKRQVNGVADAE